MKITAIFLIFFLLLFILGSTLSADTIIDTLYSIPELDGSITHSPGLSYFGIGTNSPYGIVGDYYSNILWDYFFNRSFFAFELPIIPEGYFLALSHIYIYQFTSEGNGIVGNYPIFDMSSGTFEPPCLIEHLDYGYTLDETDFFLSPLHFIGTISDTPEVGWRSIEVTEFVLDDIENERPFTQYRLRLAIDMDEDQYVDALGFPTSETSMDLKPFIIYVIEEDSNISNEQLPENQVYFLINYPNPFNPSTTISFLILEEGIVELSVYNIKGQKIRSLLNDQITTGEHSIVWDGKDASGKKVGSGIYLYRLNVNGKIEAIKKGILLK